MPEPESSASPAAPASARRRPRLGGGTAITVALAVTNACSYAYTILAAHALGPRRYGAFAALMGLLLVAAVVQLGLQATTARRVAADPEEAPAIERSALRLGAWASLALGIAFAALAPAIDVVLHLDSLVAALLVAVTAMPMTFSGAQLGVLQGEREWARLAAVYLAQGVPRLLIGAGLEMLSPSTSVAMLGIAISQAVPILVGWWALQGHRRARREAEHPVREMLTEMLHGSHALLAFLALSNVDVLVARHVLDRHDSGLYASGLIAAKAVLFLPQFVVVIAFPSMASAAARVRALFGSLTVVLVVGLMCAAGAAVLSGLALAFVGGARYAAVRDSLWLFALLGTVLSLLQLLVYGVLARQSRRAVLLIWAALLAVVAAGQTAHSWQSLLTVVTLVDVGLTVVLVAVSAYRLRPQG